jgi:putative acetyltransferase
VTNDDAVVVSAYRPEHREAFERLNRAWLEAHALLEPVDLEYLRDPESMILAHGGAVFTATAGDDVVGCCAALRLSASAYELAKLAVDPRVRRRGVGGLLCDRVAAFAAEAGARELTLTSHTSLVDALRLYESLGFRRAPMPVDVRYATANVYMVLALEQRRGVKPEALGRRQLERPARGAP